MPLSHCSEARKEEVVRAVLVAIATQALAAGATCTDAVTPRFREVFFKIPTSFLFDHHRDERRFPHCSGRFDDDAAQRQRAFILPRGGRDFIGENSFAQACVRAACVFGTRDFRPRGEAVQFRAQSG